VGPARAAAPAPVTIEVVAVHPIRVFGDPVLRQRAAEVETVDASLLRLVDDMIQTMHDAPGVGLAAPQVGVQRRLFVYDIGEGPQVLVNPRLLESSGSWSYEEGCLSVPGLAWEIERPDRVHVHGYDLEGNEVDIEAEEYLGRVLQHELDHLDGVLLIERLDPEQRREAMRALRERALGAGRAQGPGAG
jgi:peptide deformylase